MPVDLQATVAIAFNKVVMESAVQIERMRIATPPFVLSVVLLGTAAFLSGPIASRMEFRLAKRALPLKTPLSALRESALDPYRVRKRNALEPAVVDALGTEEYLDLLLEDTSEARSSPTRFLRLFVTYYSGGSNLVPHTPDVCYLGAGYALSQPHENKKIEVPALGLDAAMVPVRVCTFARTAVFDRVETSVVYTFYTNDRFLSTRTQVRLEIHNPTHRYAFFSKVEVSFPNATRQQCLDGARKLFGRVLPLLIRDHWPDFQAAEESARDHPENNG